MYVREDEFIEVSNVGLNPDRIIEALTSYAELRGGCLLEAVQTVPKVGPSHLRLELVMHHFQVHAPKGYRFDSKPGRSDVYGFEPVVSP